jgi:EmrB/QacA subfamily drug resistance transporter
MDRKWWTLLVVSAGTFMLLLDVTIVVVALPAIQRELHATFSDVQWVIDAYALTLAALLLTSGVLADRHGRRRLFTIGLGLFTAGSLTCGLAQSPLMLIISRSGQGIGGAILFATSLALLGHSFRGRDRGVAFAIWGAVTAVAVSVGPIVGGAITTGLSWRWIFLVNVPIGVAALVITLWRVEESRAPRPGRLDWPGFATLTGGLFGLVYGLIRASETSWGDVGVVIALGLGGALLLLFIGVELRAAHPMFDLSLFRIPTFTGGLITAFTMNASLFAMFLFLVIYLQNILGYSALGSGLRLVASTGGMLITSAISGRLSEHVPVRWLIGPGLALTGIGLLLMAGLSGTSSWTHLLPGLIVAGLGSGLVNPPLASTAIGVVAPERAGMASGVNSTFRQIGFAVAIAALGSIFASSFQNSLTRGLSSTPALAAHAGQIATLVRQGNVAQALSLAPAPLRGQLAALVRSNFASGINELLIVSGIVALIGAVCSGLFIRSRDFLPRQALPDTLDAQPVPELA